MKRSKSSNIPASVHHRLLTLAKAREEDLSLVMSPTQRCMRTAEA